VTRRYTEAPAVADAEDQLLSETFDPTDPDCPGHLPTDPPPVSCRPQPPALRPFKVYAFDSSRDQVPGNTITLQVRYEGLSEPRKEISSIAV
jgi:hypothetical protein